MQCTMSQCARSQQKKNSPVTLFLNFRFRLLVLNLFYEFRQNNEFMNCTVCDTQRTTLSRQKRRHGFTLIHLHTAHCSLVHNKKIMNLICQFSNKYSKLSSKWCIIFIRCQLKFRVSGPGQADTCTCREYAWTLVSPSFAKLSIRHYVVVYCFIRSSFRAGV